MAVPAEAMLRTGRDDEGYLTTQREERRAGLVHLVFGREIIPTDLTKSNEAPRRHN